MVRNDKERVTVVLRDDAAAAAALPFVGSIGTAAESSVTVVKFRTPTFTPAQP